MNLGAAWKLCTCVSRALARPRAWMVLSTLAAWLAALSALPRRRAAWKRRTSLVLMVGTMTSSCAARAAIWHLLQASPLMGA